MVYFDCVVVFIVKDVLGNNKIGYLEFIFDWDVMILEGEIIWYVGDVVVFVVLKRKEILLEIKNLVEVDYEEMILFIFCEVVLVEGVLVIYEKGNILFYEYLVCGNVEEVLVNFVFVVLEYYFVLINEYVFMEFECVIV